MVNFTSTFVIWFGWCHDLLPGLHKKLDEEGQYSDLSYTNQGYIDVLNCWSLQWILNQILRIEHMSCTSVCICVYWCFTSHATIFQSYMWRHRCAGGLKKKLYHYRRVLNAIDISQGSLTCPSYTDTGPPFLYGDSDTPPHLIAFYDTLEIRRTYSRLKPPASSRGCCTSKKKIFTLDLKTT